jgi:hypothetical protein
MFWHRAAHPILHLPGLDPPILRRKVASLFQCQMSLKGLMVSNAR